MQYAYAFTNAHVCWHTNTSTKPCYWLSLSMIKQKMTYIWLVIWKSWLVIKKKRKRFLCSFLFVTDYWRPVDSKSVVGFHRGVWVKSQVTCDFSFLGFVQFQKLLSSNKSISYFLKWRIRLLWTLFFILYNVSLSNVHISIFVFIPPSLNI